MTDIIQPGSLSTQELKHLSNPNANPLQHQDSNKLPWLTSNVHDTLDQDSFSKQFGGKNFNYMLNKSHELRNAGDDENKRTYIASKWAVPFHMDSTSSIKALKAGVGTGKTSCICVELQRLACLQPPDKNGIRWSKCLAVRGTHNELKTTTLKTWQHWAPNTICKVTTNPYIRAVMILPLPDSTTVNFEIEFAAIPDLAACSQLRGREYTFAWLNELPEIKQPIEVMQEVESRLHRFPSVDVAPIRWSGTLIDFNPSAIGGPVYKFFANSLADEGMSEEVSLYEYPSALTRVPDKADPENFSKSKWIPNPEADFHRFNNKSYGYWMTMAKKYSHDEDYIRRNVMGDWTMGTGSKSCFPTFSRRVHVGNTYLDKHSPVLIGADGSIMPAIIMGQIIQGTLYIHRELVIDDVTTEDLLDAHLVPMLSMYYPNQARMVFHDPGNNSRSEQAKDIRHRPLHRWRQRGFDVNHIPVSANKTKIRHEAVTWFLNRRSAIVIHPRCEMLIQAMSGRYQWRIRKNEEMSTQLLTPLKNRFADIADSLQYLCLGIRNNQSNIYDGQHGQEDIDQRWGRPLAPSAGVTSNNVSVWDLNDPSNANNNLTMNEDFVGGELDTPEGFLFV